MNETVDIYRFNPSTDMLLPGSELCEGMWVLPEDRTMRFLGMDEDDQIRAQRFRRVTGLTRTGPVEPGGPDLNRFAAEWVDGYRKSHRSAVTHMWIVRKPEPGEGPEVSATVAKGDVIRIVPDHGPERVMLVSHVEHHLITLTDLPGEGEHDG